MNHKALLNSSWETFERVADTMLIFRLCQNGLIFTALVTGLISILHVVHCRKRICQNAVLLLIVLVTGFCNMMVTVYMLQLSELSSETNLPRGSVPYCSDYFLPATVSNTIVLLAIVFCVIRHNIRPTLEAWVTWTLTMGCVLTGLVIVSYISYNTTTTQQHGTFVTLGQTDQLHLDVFWSVCPAVVQDNSSRLLVEYGLIYLPMVIAIFSSWKMSYDETSDIRKLKIVYSNCCKYEDDGVCVCSKFGTPFVAVLLYSAVLLFILRPLVIVYACATDGYFRDILPSLLHTVLYCFICCEYLTKQFSINCSYEPNRMQFMKGRNKVLYV